MIVRKALAALACAGLVFGSSAAAAAPVAIDDVRASSPVAESDSLRGMRGSFGIILILIIIAGVLGVVLAGDEGSPESP
jgi:hypothetical protein